MLRDDKLCYKLKPIEISDEEPLAFKVVGFQEISQSCEKSFLQLNVLFCRAQLRDIESAEPSWELLYLSIVLDGSSEDWAR